MRIVVVRADILGGVPIACQSRDERFLDDSWEKKLSVKMQTTELISCEGKIIVLKLRFIKLLTL